MPLDCHHHVHRAHVRRRVADPTRTTWLRRKYEADMVRRFKALRRLIVEAVAVNDVFGLAEPAPLARLNESAPPRRAFDFPRSDAKVSAFMNWLRQASAAGILEVHGGTPILSSGARAWQNVYLQTAYQAGIQSAASNMQAQGATVEPSWVQSAFLRPIHADRAGLIYTRAYSELDGITARMSAEISRTLAQGIAEGRGMRELSRTLAERVDVGIKRARALTRTEVIRAHADATLNSYTEAGLEGVEIEAEFSSTDDNKRCPKCADLEGTVYIIQEARGKIPVHPNCRCAFVPVVRDPSGVVLL